MYSTNYELNFSLLNIKLCFLKCNYYHNLFYVKHNIANNNGFPAIAFNYRT